MRGPRDDRSAFEKTERSQIALALFEELGVVPVPLLEEQEASDDGLVSRHMEGVGRAIDPACRRLVRRKHIDRTHRDRADRQRLFGKKDGREELQHQERNRGPRRATPRLIAKNSWNVPVFHEKTTEQVECHAASREEELAPAMHE